MSVSRKHYLNTPENAANLQRVISEARIAGLVDWDYIKDRGRITHSLSSFPDLKTYLQKLNENFRIDRWKRQENYVEVMVEKQALEGVLLPVCVNAGMFLLPPTRGIPPARLCMIVPSISSHSVTWSTSTHTSFTWVIMIPVAST
jgi:hypothetical protein